MPRIGRIVIPGCPHHITQRGNNRQDVFFVDEDRRVYLELLAEQAERFGLRIDGYCLMTNHIHLIGTPRRAESLAQAVGRTHFRYTQHVNRMHARSGHLWQNRFYSCALGDEQFWTAMAYVERNPVRAKLARKPWQFPWSSAAAHTNGADTTGLLDLAAWTDRLPRGLDWRDALTDGQDDATIERVRLSTSRGRPLGGDSWISKLETTLNRRLRPLPVGRPRKKRNKAKGKNR